MLNLTVNRLLKTPGFPEDQSVYLDLGDIGDTRSRHTARCPFRQNELPE